jgi:type III secretion protein S
MDQSTIVGQFQAAMYLVAAVALPPLLVAMVTGLVIAILQSATQIQDQTLPLTVKLIAVGLVLATLGPSLTRPLIEYASRVFEEFPMVAR